MRLSETRAEWSSAVLDIHRSYPQNWNSCWSLSVFLRADVWPMRTVVRNKCMLKIAVCLAWREKVSEDCGSLLKPSCPNSSQCSEEIRGCEINTMPALLLFMSLSLFQLIDHITRIQEFLSRSTIIRYDSVP